MYVLWHTWGIYMAPNHKPNKIRLNPSLNRFSVHIISIRRDDRLELVCFLIVCVCVCVFFFCSRSFELASLIIILYICCFSIFHFGRKTFRPIRILHFLTPRDQPAKQSLTSDYFPLAIHVRRSSFVVSSVAVGPILFWLWCKKRARLKAGAFHAEKLLCSLCPVFVLAFRPGRTPFIPFRCAFKTMCVLLL